MKITATGKSRVVYPHTVADSEITYAGVENGRITCSIESSKDPGIQSGKYNLKLEFDKEEVDRLFATAVTLPLQARISELEAEIRDLKRRQS